VLDGYFRYAGAFVGIERALAHATDRLIAVSDEVRDDLVRLHVAPRRKFAIVPYGFDLDRRIAREPTKDVGDGFVIGWAGRLTAIKRPLDLVRTAARIDGSVLVLAGDGELRGEVETLARDSGVDARFLGYVDDLGRWYASFDAFLLTSQNEGAPVVAIEAQAAGVPVVATDAGGTRTVVDDGETGFVVPIGDVKGLADRLTQLRDDPELRRRLGETGARRMREKFSTERMVDDVERLYATIIPR
jgi:glycosyltransferase involved in cell wall biosynthesis